MATVGIGYSQQFRRAARAERNRLLKRRAKLVRQRKELQGKVDDYDRELEQLHEHIQLHEKLIGPEAELGNATPDGPSGPSSATELSGRAVREVAVSVLLRSHESDLPIHYKDWLRLVEQAGYSVLGKRPESVFNNQVNRSPIIRSTTKSGIYVLDREALKRLRAKLQQLYDEFAAAEGHTVRSAQLLDIQRCERNLSEAEAALSDPDRSAATKPT